MRFGHGAAAAAAAEPSLMHISFSCRVHLAAGCALAPGRLGAHVKPVPHEVSAASGTEGRNESQRVVLIGENPILFWSERSFPKRFCHLP
jgi:hypothetical protein